MRHISRSVSALLLTFLLSCTSSEKAKQRYLTKANELAQSGNVSEARLNYKKALQKDPRFGEASVSAGLLALKENQIWEAYNALNLAVSLSPENQEAKVAFANLCLKMYLTDPHRTKTTYDRVVSLSTALLQKNPSHTTAYDLRDMSPCSIGCQPRLSNTSSALE
jgi:tetratricopeptide (TPR) repeat protein